MRKQLCLATGILFSAMTCASATDPAAEKQETPTPAAAAVETSSSGEDPHLQQLLARIAGKEDEPAEKVFKNVQVLKGMPAARFLRVMSSGYSRSLGVTCEHCHTVTAWESDEKRAKLAAREMIVLTRDLNRALRSMKNLDTTEPVVNCATCHRAQLEPATSVEAQ